MFKITHRDRIFTFQIIAISYGISSLLLQPSIHKCSTKKKSTLSRLLVSNRSILHKEIVHQRSLPGDITTSCDWLILTWAGLNFPLVLIYLQLHVCKVLISVSLSRYLSIPANMRVTRVRHIGHIRVASSFLSFFCLFLFLLLGKVLAMQRRHHTT